MNDGRLLDKVAIVTGGASGIGRGICAEFARQGANVAVADINFDGANQVAEEIMKEGGKAFAVDVDLTDPSRVAGAVDSVLQQAQTIDILVNCAGWNTLKPVQQFSKKEWEKIRSLNLDGPWHMSQAVMPTMIEQQHGKIINIASGSGILAQPHMSAYGTAKHGLVGMTKTLAVDLAKYQINVNCICPATVATPLAMESTSEAYRQFQTERIPLGRLGKVSDVAKASLFLSSSESDWITGVILPVDGGLTCCAMAQPITDLR